MDWRRINEVVVTETSLPNRMGVNTDSKGSVLCRVERISGTAFSDFATRLAAFLVEYDFRRLEKAESAASDGWTETTTSLDRYAIRAAVHQIDCQPCSLFSCNGRRMDRASRRRLVVDSSNL
jgi:hypothetical protein